VILAVDDPQVLRAVERDLRRRYAGDYRVLRAESGESQKP
jgi:thioredoxin reductase (NADPH)